MRQNVTFRRLKGYRTALAFLTISGLGGVGQGAGAQMAVQTSAVQTYTVRPGDTAYSVARLAGTDVPTLLRLNNLTSADLRLVTLKPEQVLKLPAGPPQPAPAQPASVRPAPSRPAAAQAAPPRSHTVQPGQTLYSVARLYGLKTGEVQEFNRLSSAELKPGQVLMLPVGVQGVQASLTVGPAPVAVAAPSRPAPPRPTPPRPTPPRPAAMSPAPLLGVQLPSAVPPRHTVQPGQTLYAVARLYNLRADDLLALNQLTSSDLRAGQVLLLPAGVTVQPAASSSMLPGVADSPSAVPGRTIFSPGVPLPVMLPVPFTPNLPTPNLPTPGSPRSELSPPDVAPALADSPSDWRGVAMSLLGVPYVYGGQSRTGTDCSGLVLQVFAGTGLKLPRQSAQQAQTGAVVGLPDLQAGDLLFFDTEGRGTVTHVGIYLGDGNFINANSYGGQVAVNQLSEKYFAQRYLWARRVLGVLAQDH